MMELKEERKETSKERKEGQMKQIWKETSVGRRKETTTEGCGKFFHFNFFHHSVLLSISAYVFPSSLPSLSPCSLRRKKYSKVGRTRGRREVRSDGKR